MKRLLLSAVLALGTVCLWSQDLPKIAPPTPEAASLAKFGEIPISHYTGLPNINIPFYTIQQDGVSIPIGLSYHARGMKVNEVASRTGIGWALNYGGSLSRQTRGKVDESSFGFNAIRNMIKTATHYDANNANTAETTRRALIQRYIDGYDFFPDKFMFSANGVSGNFTINHQDLETLTQQYKDIDISYSEDSNGKIESFVITDGQGNKFYYGATSHAPSSPDYRTALNSSFTEISYIYRENGGGISQYGGDTEGPFANGWPLLEIVTTKGTSIEFYYEEEESLNLQRSYDRYFPGSVTSSDGQQVSFNTAYGGYIAGNSLISSPLMSSGQASVLESYFSKVRTKQHQIKEIVFDTGKIKFVEGASRQDYGGNVLDKVQILDTDDNTIKQFQLGYEYKTGATNGNEHSYLIQNETKASKRLFLTSVQELDDTNNVLPAHTFEYNNQAIPNRFSNSQDAWGYYNGADNGEYLTFFSYGSNTNNRTVDVEKSMAGILEKITYPTGGSTSFTYEHNIVRKSVAYNEVVTSGINPLSARDEGLSHLEYNSHYNSGSGAYEKQFDIHTVWAGGTAGIAANVYIQAPNAYCGVNEPNQTACNFSITLTNNAGGSPIQLYNGNNTIYTSSVPVGTYTLKVKPQNHVHDHTNPDHGFIVTLNWKEQEFDDGTLVYAGGKRIKRIEHKDSNDNLVSFKEYEYVDPFLGGTSGELFGLPNFMSIHGVNDSTGGTILAPTGASPGTPLSSMQGNSVGYEYVTEYIGDKINNIGKIEYAYTVPQDVGNYYQYPYNLPTDNSWLRGNNVYTKYYKKENDNSFSLKKEVLNTYMYAGVRHANSYSNPQVYLQPSSYLRDIDLDVLSDSEYEKDRNKYNMPLMLSHFISGSVNDPNHQYKVYHLNGGTQNLQNTTTKEYYENGKMLTTFAEYFYDNAKHYQLKSSKMTDSKGDVMETINYYPADVGGFSSLGYDNLSGDEYNAIHKMKSPDINPNGTNQVAIPVQVETKKNTNVVSVARTNFKIESVSGFVLPKSVETLKGVYNATSNPLEERIVYHSYYENGNVQEVSKTDGTHIVYIWGYDQTVPVAKIENATYSQVSSYVAGIQSASNADNDRTVDTVDVNGNVIAVGSEGALRSAITTLRSALPNAQVTSFTYDPLIGVTSVTDLRGRTVYYLYDSFNRQQYVKDHEGNVLSKNEYHYKN